MSTAEALAPAIEASVYLRPQTISQILASTMTLMKRHFWRFMTVFLLPSIPAHLVFVTGVQSQSVPLSVTGFILLFSTYMLVVPMLTVMIGDICLGEKPSIRHAVSRAAQRMGIILANSLLQAIIIFIAFLLLIVPGVIMLVQLVFISPISTLEDKRWGMAAVRRSQELTKGQRWRIAGLLLLLFVIGFSLGLVTMPLRLAAQALPGGLWVDYALQNILQSIGNLFGLVSAVLLYYETLARREGLTPDILMQNLAVGD